MTTYRLAACLTDLRDEINRAAPRRSKRSDGWIGDPDHASRVSDHNPWVKDESGVGIVRAFDFTHDPSGGLEAGVLAERLRRLGATGDPRLANGGYVIFDRRIASAAKDWQWRTYAGPNPHTQHVHVSVSRYRAGYDKRGPWLVAVSGVTPPPKAAPVRRPATKNPDPEVDMPITQDEIDRIADRVVAKLADPRTNPGTVVDPGVRNAVASIEAGVMDKVSGVRRIVIDLAARLGR